MKGPAPVLACLLLIPAAVPGAFAALAPLSPDELEQRAELVITGEVLASRVLVHRRPGVSTYLVRLGARIDSVEKGETGESAKTIEIRCRALRSTRLAGRTGHDDIPADGARFRMWLRKNGDGHWEPLEPNGIEPLEGAGAMSFAEVERSNTLRHYLIAGGIGLLALASFGAFRFRDRLFRSRKRE